MPPKKSNPKGRYIIHSNHTSLPVERQTMHYISFDPGRKNFDLRIERRNMSQVGTTCASIKTVIHQRLVVNYARSTHKAGAFIYTTSESTLAIIAILDNVARLLEHVDIALIEGQMDTNREMMHMQHTIITYLILRYPNIVVVEPSSKLKSKNLNAPPNLNRYHLKKWSVVAGKEYATLRGDKKFLRHLKELEALDIKLDDSTDNLLQIEAMCVEAGYQLTCLD